MLLIAILAGVIIYNYDYIFRTVQKKYDKWISLNNMVSTQYRLADKNLSDAKTLSSKQAIIKDRIMIKLISFKIILISLYLNILEYYNYICGTKIRKIEKNKYSLTYVVNNKNYKMILTPLRGPPPVLRISDQDDNDITDKVEEYMGIHYDFHNIKYKTSFFNCDQIHFEMYNGDIKTFFVNEEINLNT